MVSNFKAFILRVKNWEKYSWQTTVKKDVSNTAFKTTDLFRRKRPGILRLSTSCRYYNSALFHPPKALQKRSQTTTGPDDGWRCWVDILKLTTFHCKISENLISAILDLGEYATAIPAQYSLCMHFSLDKHLQCMKYFYVYPDCLHNWLLNQKSPSKPGTYFWYHNSKH